MRRALAAAALALLALAGGAPAGGQESPDGRISLSGQTSWVRPDGPFQLRVGVDRVRGAEALDVVVTVHRMVRTRSQFVRTLDGELLGSQVASQRSPLEDLRFGPGGAILTLRLPALPAGVYPVSVSLRERGGGPVDGFTTHLVRLPDRPAELPLGVAWIQPIRAQPSLSPDGTQVLPEHEVRRLRGITDALVAAPATALTVDATPEVLEALDAAGHEDLVGRLRGRDVLAAPYVDLDVGALVGAGLGDRLEAQRAAGAEVLERLLGTGGDSRTWSSDDPLDDRSLARLRSLGVRRVVVDEATLEPLDPRITNGITLARPFALAAGTDATVEAASVDPGLVAHLANPEPVLGAHHLLADLAVLFFDSPGVERGVVVRPPERANPDPELLRIVLPALAEAANPIVRPVTVADLFELEPLTAGGEIVERSLVEQVGRLGMPASELRLAGDAVAGFGGLVGDEHEALPLLHRLLLVAEADGLSPDARRRYLAAVHDEVEGVRADVRLVAGRTFRLTAREGTIPITVVNDNPFPVTTTLQLASDKLEFAGADDADRGRLVLRDLVLQPGTTTRTVPVAVRTSGDFPLRATLLDATGTVELFRTSYTVRSMAASGVGLVLSAGAGLFLLLWWASHWRTVRRDRRLVGAGH